jgi:hypothetical protein
MHYVEAHGANAGLEARPTIRKVTYTAPLPDCELVLSSPARLQQVLEEAVLAGEAASIPIRFDDAMRLLESVAGARMHRPVQLLGNLDGIETSVRQLDREEPLETMVVEHKSGGVMITVPTEAERLRVKGVLILRRNATRDYLDFVALADHLGNVNVIDALCPFDRLYEQRNGESTLQQLQAQLASAMPFDLEEMELSEDDWNSVRARCWRLSSQIFDGVCERGAGVRPDRSR